MRIICGNSLTLLLLLALPGCQSVLPWQTQLSSPSSDGIQRLPPTLPAEAETSLPVAEKVTLVGYDEPETIPTPAIAARSEPANALRLADLEAMALESNPTLSAALAKVEAAQGQQVQAGLYPNPVFGYHAMQIGQQGTAGQQGAFASQKFITAGKLGLDQAIAERSIQEAQAQFHAQRQRVLSDVRVRFYETLVAQRRVELAKELTEIGDNLVEASEKLLEGRVGTENNLLQAQIRAEESEIEFENSINQRREAWKRLAAILGQPHLTMTPLDGKLAEDLPDYAWEECSALVLDGNPELAAARIRVERADISLRRSEVEPIPNVDLLLSTRHDNITKYDITNVQLGIPIPVFNKNQGNIRSADAEWIYANREVERIELDLQDRLAVAYRQFANAKQQVEKYRDRILPRASKSLELVTNGYEMGQVEYLTLLTAQQTYIQANLTYLDSLRELRTAAAIIEGQLLSQSLSGN